jgi:hypothetical protein
MPSDLTREDRFPPVGEAFDPWAPTGRVQMLLIDDRKVIRHEWRNLDGKCEWREAEGV